jgi:hypothetical protein
MTLPELSNQASNHAGREELVWLHRGSVPMAVAGVWRTEVEGRLGTVL